MDVRGRKHLKYYLDEDTTGIYDYTTEVEETAKLIQQARKEGEAIGRKAERERIEKLPRYSHFNGDCFVSEDGGWLSRDQVLETKGRE
jgi:hypothetical protein